MVNEWKDFAFIIDPAEIKLAVFRDLSFEENVETPGTDAKEDQWLWDVGLKPKLVEKHSLLRMS